ncbi:hypothetical protein SAMN05444746_13712 [Variovorax sp. OK212]|nr:hypothetical protein SAMN05518853_13912 [Variovorax sp. OK202]SFE76013.1 hypothetical protein SAMN05444746_13712 [Variovorax sp. OK212]
MDAVAAQSKRETVRFMSEGVALSGHMYLPASAKPPGPAVVLCGPMTFVKEQAFAQYAHRLAGAGFVELTFDPRSHGQSEGMPRDVEDPLGKAVDVRQAIGYLASRPEVAAKRIGAVGFCAGSASMLRATADEPRIRALTTVAGMYRDHPSDVAVLVSESGVTERRERGAKALAAFKAAGEVSYVPAIDPTRADVAMVGAPVWDWYSKWAEAGVWPNQYAVMSDALVHGCESLTAAKHVKVPYLMLHSGNSVFPDAARRHYEGVPAGKELLWAKLLITSSFMMILSYLIVRPRKWRNGSPGTSRERAVLTVLRSRS